MSLAFTTALVPIVWLGGGVRSACRVIAAAAFGVLTGVGLAFFSDPAYFSRWALESVAVIKTYSQGLGFLPVFTLFDAEGTSLWIIPMVLLLFALTIAVSSRSRGNLELFVTVALALAAMTYFVGRAHPNNLLHVAPFLVVVLVAAAAQHSKSRSGARLLGVLGWSRTCREVLPSMGKHRWFLGRPNLTAIAVSGIALAFVVTTLVLTSHKVSLYRDALKALDQSGASLALPRSTQYLSNRVGTAVLVAVTPDAEFPVRLALSRTSIATFGLPEQDAFGLGPEPLVRDAALSAGCVLIVTSANEQDVPATPLRALALAQELFPVQVRKWTEGDFRMEARSRVGASGC